MGYQDLVDIVRKSGVRILDRQVPASSLGLPDSARARVIAELGGLLRIYHAETTGTLPSTPRVRSNLEATGYDCLALITKDGQQFLTIHVTAAGEEAHRTVSDTEAAGLLTNIGLSGDADGALASERILDLLRLEEKPKAYNKGGSHEMGNIVRLEPIFGLNKRFLCLPKRRWAGEIHDRWSRPSNS